MFKMTKSASYYWPVAFTTPADGGKFEKQTFDAQFKRITQSRFQELLGISAAANEEADEQKEKMTDSLFVREVTVGWRGINDDAGNEIVFSEGALADILEVPGVARAMVMAYVESFSGAKIKN